MPKIHNNTAHPVVFHSCLKNGLRFQITIPALGNAEVEDKLWKKFKKNSRVKDMIKKGEIVSDTLPGLLEKIIKFFY